MHRYKRALYIYEAATYKCGSLKAIEYIYYMTDGNIITNIYSSSCKLVVMSGFLNLKYLTLIISRI